jgi:hypothetical protein
MGWEKRGNKRYFYRIEKRQGRSVRTYYNSGEIAELAATAEAIPRVQREIEDRRRKREQEPLATAETLVNELCEQSDRLVRATLVASGYRRKGRMKGAAHVNENLQTNKNENAAGEEVVRSLERAEKGDATVLPQLRRLLNESPALWRGYGELAAHARAAWVKLVAGSNGLMAECLEQKSAELRREVAGDSPSPLEQLLADRVVVSWLQTSFYDGVIAQTSESASAQLGELQKQHQAAHRRYLAAIKTLATVRQRLTPSKSPVEASCKRTGKHSALRLRKAPEAESVSVPD